MLPDLRIHESGVNDMAECFNMSQIGYFIGDGTQRSLAAASGLFVFLKGLDQRLILSKSCHAYKVSYPPFGVIVVRLLHQPVVSNESAKLLDQSGRSIWIHLSRGLSGVAEVRHWKSLPCSSKECFGGLPFGRASERKEVDQYV